MIFSRFKSHDWHRSRCNRIVALRRSVLHSPQCLIESDCRLFLQAVHQGPWRMIWALTRYEIQLWWWYYFGAPWEWAKVKVFRGKPDKDLAEFARAEAENEALEEMVSRL